MVPVIPGYDVDLFTRRWFWRLDPLHHYLPDAWMGLGIDCTGWRGLPGWTREQTTPLIISFCGLTRSGPLSCTKRWTRG